MDLLYYPTLNFKASDFRIFFPASTCKSHIFNENHFVIIPFLLFFIAATRATIFRILLIFNELWYLIDTNVKCMLRPQIFSIALRIANLGMLS